MTIAAAEQGRFGPAFEWLGIERAWTRTRGSPDVLIGIVDQGVQRDHPLLGPNIRRDHVTHPPSAESDEIAGTHAAGVAAGRASDAERFSGVAPDARILPVRFTARPGPQALDFAHAIEYAVEMGACIVNVSHLGDVSSASVLRAIQYAATRNALVVCSATAAQPGEISEEDAPNLLSVLSVDEQRLPLELGVGAAHLAAPGFARVPHWRGSGHSVFTGPGLGAPYVSGCAALVKSLNPAWGYHEIKEHLLTSGTPSDEPVGNCRTGGVLNVANAVLGPIEHTGTKAMTWSSLSDVELHWQLRYRSALCANVVALYHPRGDEHWRELGHARARDLKLTIPSDALRRSSGTLRIAARESNFHADDIELTVL
jgi:subtilisin family serine protease